jgi:hypothetical protein
MPVRIEIIRTGSTSSPHMLVLIVRYA